MSKDKENPVRNLTVSLVSLDWLKGYEGNAKQHPPEQVERLAKSIRRFGFNNPVLARPDGVLVAGHGRVLAATTIGLKEVPCIILPDLTDDEAQAYCLADNRIGDLGEWDESTLKNELVELSEKDLDLMISAGWTEVELAHLLHDELVPDLADSDDEVEPQEVPISKPGDVWLLGDHRIICGDCTNAETVARLLDGKSPHLMVTDPPYGVEYNPSWRADAGINKNKDKMGEVLNDDRADWTEAWSLFPGDVAYVWHASLFTTVVLKSLEDCGFVNRSMIIWAKDRFTLGRGHYHWQHEPCWYVVRKGETGHWNGDRSQSTLWEIAARDDKGHGHSTQKPVECMLRPIVNNSLPGDYVYEPFSGSGTTIIACEQSKRKCLAIELNPAYVDVAVRRWQKVTGKAATLESSGQTFDAISGEVNRPI